MCLNNDKYDRLLKVTNDISSRLRESYIKKVDLELFNEINSSIGMSFREKVYYWCFDIDNYISCICGNKLSMRKNWRDGFVSGCSPKCRANNMDVISKRENTNIEKYGVSNVSKLNSIKEKISNTNIKRYGAKSSAQNELVKEKIKNTNLEKYGVDNVAKLDSIKGKSRKTSIENFGVDHYSKTDEFKNRIKESSLIKYAVDHFSKLDYQRKKMIDNNPMFNDEFYKNYKLSIFDKFGVDNIMKNSVIRDKAKITNLEKYGGHYTKSSSFRSNNYIKYLGNGMSLFQCDCGKDHTFEINYYSRKNSNLSLCTICYPIDDNKSIKEKMLLEYIKSIYNGEIISGYRDELEIDIYLPELNIGFEFNGLYWHSDEFKDNQYHIKKQEYFKEKGIRIIYIWEDDWAYKNSIIKSQINNWLGSNNNKIYARKCTVKVIDNVDIVRNFLNNNHIQGFVGSTVKLGLYYNDELVSLMTFDKFEGRKLMSNGYNLSRFCNKLNTNVIGAASKLLKYFINNYDCERIVSYADKEWSLGNLYYKLGFELKYTSKPNYKYVVNGKRRNKQKFKKSDMMRYISDENLDVNNITENRLSKILNYSKVYDCGQMKFEKIIK